MSRFVERMPAGTIGLEAVDKVTDDVDDAKEWLVEIDDDDDDDDDG